MSQGFFLGNRILDISLIAAGVAQIYKVISPIFKGKGLDWSRMWATGGMPSSHSSAVTSLATSVGILNGYTSVEFAISVVFSIIIMYDAAGVRRAAGKHAGILNSLMEIFKEKEDFRIKQIQLKELLGHEPTEVIAGAILGIVMSFIMMPYLRG